MSAQTKIKFCGITSPADALQAVQLGADAIGVVVYANSPRRVSPERAGEIVASVRDAVETFLLFVDAPRDVVQATVRSARPHFLQLNGSESPSFVSALSPVGVVKALRVQPSTVAAELEEWRGAVATAELSNLAGIVLETPGVVGGSGIENNWSCIEELRQRGRLTGFGRWMVAGGLNPDNVESVVRRIRPPWVDVSSGIESEPGRKSPILMAKFVAGVKRACTKD
jgi:phosphoribosylanthranilate isomerase